MKMCVLVCRLRFQLRSASQFAMLSIRLRLKSVIDVGDCNSYLQFKLAIHIRDSVYYHFFVLSLLSLYG